MDQFRRGAHEEIINNKDSSSEEPTRSSAFNPPSIIRDSSAFSRPLLPSSSSLLSPKHPAHFNGSSAIVPGSAPDLDPYPASRYRECLRNHAATLGGHVVDGCCEFMPAGPTDPLKCAACGCHRSFHRKEPEPNNNPNPKSSSYRVPLLLSPPPHNPNPLRLSGNTTDQSSSEERNTPNTNHHNSSYDYSRHGQMGSDDQGRKKRFRTKFSSDQKEKMQTFAERVGWRVQKKDEGEMERFCSEVGVSRQVLKVWMHNNKHLAKRQEAMQLEGRSESKVEDDEVHGGGERGLV